MRLMKNGAQVATSYYGSISYESTESTVGTVTFLIFAEGVPGMQGAPVILQKTVVVVSANQPPIGVIDEVSTTVSPAGVLLARGWAADNEMGSPVSQVQVFIDNVSVGVATLGGARPDVATAYGKSTYASAGWTFSYGIGSLSAGVHTFSCQAKDNQGAVVTLGTRNFTVDAHRPTVSLSSSVSATVAGNVSFPIELRVEGADTKADLTSLCIDLLSPAASDWVSG